MKTLEEIKLNIINWVSDNLGTNFKFRKYQLESIIFIIKSILNDDRETSIIEAPTGSGKSLICIICAGVLYKFYNMKSYILCSDLFLWQQYVDLINNKNLKQYGYLKGSIGNYTCFVNKQDFSCSRCKLAKISYQQLKDENWCERNMYTCVKKCVYMQQRFRAERSPITLMTYQLWLHHMNLVNEHAEISSFKKRDIIFCDECHNIPDIVQNFCGPVIKERDISKLMDIFDYTAEHDIQIQINKLSLKELSFLFYDNISLLEEKELIDFNQIFDSNKIKNNLQSCFSGISIYENNNNKIIEILNLYINILSVIDFIVNKIENDIKSLFNTSKIDKEDLSLAHKVNWYSTYKNSILDYLKAIDKSGTEFILIETTEDTETKEKSFQLNCAKEDYLCNEYVLRHAKHKILLSATVGSQQSFDDNIGTKYTTQKISYFSKIPSTFNFEKSPIYYIPKYKMNYANKTVDFPKISEITVKILTAYNNIRGIIHTGSYENARLFYNMCPKEIKKRMFLYGNSKQKELIMHDFKNSLNGILVGPTLTEGIDLPNDYCRFIILMKVPYPNITSKLVKKKIELFPLWYNSTTSNAIIQSIGRGIRNETDYCTTYILDGCFSNLYYQTIDQYPDHIKNRIKFITS